MDIFEFHKINEGFYSIEMGMVRSFMFVDDKEILLIDLGLGGNDLKGQVKGFKDLPIRVVFTHGDGDHVGDAQNFENRFMHPSEWDYYTSKNENNVPMQPIWEGDIITNGDYKLEVILIPGHTPGSIALIEREKKFLIGGDSIQKGPIFMFGNGRNLLSLKASMIKLEKDLEGINNIYVCHHELFVNNEVIKDMRDSIDVMLTSPPEGIPQDRFNNQIKLYKTDKVSFFMP